MRQSMRCWALGIPLVLGVCSAASVSAPEPVTLTETGEKLKAQYAATLAALQAEIAKALPAVGEGRKAALPAAREAFRKAEADVAAAQAPLNKIEEARALVGHAKGKWLGGAEKGLAEAEAMRQKAVTPAEREAAEKERVKWQADKEAGLKALAERQAALDAAQADEPKYIQASQAAKAALAAAEANELKAAKDAIAGVMPFLSSDELDAKLVACVVLAQATPRGLAEFAQQGREQEALVGELLADGDLMKQMLVADGAKGGKYGHAMAIYAAIQKASSKAKEGLFQRLALAISLEHAVPIAQSNPEADTNAPAVVDPVKRYLHFEKAYLDGELDPAFKSLSAWEYRMAVNGDEPDHILAWGREMLRNYRPDHVLNPDYGWRYSGAVRTDVRYGSQNVKYDRPELQKYQNIILNGGVCGRRAFFGRFILRSFGIPTVPRPQTGHAALAHWTPDGWVINLGANWGSGRVDNGPDTIFLLRTQARKHPADFLKVLRAQWVGDALGEQKYNGSREGSGGLWSVMAHFAQKAIVADAKSLQLAARGTQLGEADESAETRAAAVAKATVTDADKRIVTGPNGAITIPAAACGGGNQLVKSFLGGQQMICGGPFTCVVDVPKAGTYALTARVVTVHSDTRLLLTPNDAKAPVDMPIPFTLGAWQQTAPVEVTLSEGKNTLAFTNPTAAFALKDLTLTPGK